MTADDVVRRARDAGIPVSPSLHLREASVAKFFDVGLTTVRRWRDEGTGPQWTRLGGGIFYPCDRIAEWMNESESAQK